MTSQDYVIIAAILKDIAQGYEDSAATDDFDEDVSINVMPRLAKDFARELAKTNPRFNKDKFLAACKPVMQPYKR